MTSPMVIFWTVLLLMITIFRYYGDVEYRLNLNYQKYFIYYSVLTVGYLVGFGLYFLTGNWFLVFVTGEAAAILYACSDRNSIQKFFPEKSVGSAQALRRGGFLVFSYLITNLTLNIDLTCT